MKKTILYIGGFELPDKNAAAQRVMSNAKLLRDIGYEVILVGVDKSSQNYINIQHTKKSCDGFTTYHMKYPHSTIDWFAFLFQISQFTQLAACTQASYIIAYNFPAVALFRLLKWAKKHNVLLISDCTEWYQPQGGFLFKFIKGLDVYLRMKVIQPRLHGVVAISRYLYDYYSPKMKNTLLLPPLVDKEDDKWNVKLQERTVSCLRLVYAGSPGGGGKDRLDQILFSLERLRKEKNVLFEFQIIGITREQYLNSYKLNSIPDSINCYVSFLGRRSHMEVINSVANSDYQIFIRENNLVNTAGFPTKFAEAISCGTPVISNLSSNLSDYLKDGCNGLVLDISNQEVLTQSLLKVFQISRKSISVDCNIFDYRNYMKDVKDFMEVMNGRL